MRTGRAPSGPGGSAAGADPKARATDLLNQLNETRRPVIISRNGEPRAVLRDPGSYGSMRATLGLMWLTSRAEVFSRIERAAGKE